MQQHAQYILDMLYNWKVHITTFLSLLKSPLFVINFHVLTDDNVFLDQINQLASVTYERWRKLLLWERGQTLLGWIFIKWPKVKQKVYVKPVYSVNLTRTTKLRSRNQTENKRYMNKDCVLRCEEKRNFTWNGKVPYLRTIYDMTYQETRTGNCLWFAKDHTLTFLKPHVLCLVMLTYNTVFTCSHSHAIQNKCNWNGVNEVLRHILPVLSWFGYNESL
mgnify:CR=1 FL=1